VGNFGKRLTIISVIMLALCVAPIMLYAAFGPADGNPIGLGLLAVFGWPLFASLTVIGLILWVAGWIRDRRSSRAT